MSTLAVALGIVLMLIGAWVAISPERLLSVVDWESPRGLYIAVTTRVVTGIVLILASPESRSPIGFRAIGTLAFLAGLVLALTPTDRWVEFFRWWTRDQHSLYRASAALAILVGAFIVYAAPP